MKSKLMNRRTMMKVTGTAALGTLVASQVACKPRDIAFYVSTVTGALGELSPLLPGAAALIAKAVTVANDFLAAYRAGNFTNATTIFQSLSGLLSQIAADTGVNNPSVKIILAVAGVAIHAIAALLVGQVTPAIRSKIGTASLAQASVVQQLADPVAINQIFAAMKF